MECLWEQVPRTSREVVDYLKADMGWSKSTTLTMLRRMTEKGLIRCEEGGEVRLYSPWWLGRMRCCRRQRIFSAEYTREVWEC